MSVEIEMCCCYAADEVTSFREICYLCTVVTGVVFLVLMSVEIEMCCCYVADEMDADILNLNDDDYLSVEDIMAENEDDQNAQADQKAQDDSVQSVAHTRDLEWSRGALISEFLSPFAEMTKLVSDSSYPTANLYFMQVWKIESWLRDHATSEDESIREMVKIMKLKFDKY
ncbi:hypothetical protein Bca101_076906 [Brassica carinata]